MDSDSFFKGIFRGFFLTFFRTVAVGLGIVGVVVIFGIFFVKHEVPQHTAVEVLRNHDWKVKPFSNKTPTILRLNIHNIIGVDEATAEAIELQLMEAMDIALEPGQLKAILLDIDTPGGSAIDSDTIYRLLRQVKKRLDIPVYAYVNGICASGGVYIASAADKVFATKTSWIGSVGVIIPTFFNYADVLGYFGVKTETIIAGKNKDSMNPYRPWTKDETVEYKRLVDDHYETFMGIVTENRPLLTREILVEKGAEMFTIEEAKELGFIDKEVDSLSEVLKELAETAGIRKKYQVVQLELPSLLENVFGASSESTKWQKKLTDQFFGGLPKELYGKPLYMWLPQSKSSE